MPENTLQEEPTESIDLRLRPRAVETLALEIPSEVLASLRHVAQHQETTVPALLKAYIGQGLRRDIAQLFSDGLMVDERGLLNSPSPSLNERND